MQINNLKRKVANKKARPVGRGGTRGKTAGRGTKGQKARSGRKIRPEIRDLIKRIPKMRGRGKNSNISIYSKAIVINLSVLSDVFSNGDIVTPKVLREKGIIPNQGGTILDIKVLSEGEISKKLTLRGLSVSAKAKEKVEKAGGKIYG